MQDFGRRSAPAPANEALKLFNTKKLATADRIRHDGRLIPSARAVGAEIIALTNFKTGYAWCGEDYLAEQLNLAQRTVKRAIASLKAAGYFEVRKSGRSNIYFPVFEPAEQGPKWPLSETQSSPDRGQERAQQGPKATENRGQKGPPISLETTLRSSPIGVAGAAPDGAGHPPADHLGGFRARLETRLGKRTFDSWLGKAAFVSEDGDLLTLAAPGRFIADHIKNFFGGSLLEVWQCERPAIQRLEVIVAEGLRVATPARSEVSADATWLVDVGTVLVGERMRVARERAEKTVRRWLRRCGNDATSLRRIITEAAAQDLVGDRFGNFVKRQTKALLHADQPPLPLGRVALVAGGKAE